MYQDMATCSTRGLGRGTGRPPLPPTEVNGAPKGLKPRATRERRARGAGEAERGRAEARQGKDQQRPSVACSPAIGPRCSCSPAALPLCPPRLPNSPSHHAPSIPGSVPPFPCAGPVGAATVWSFPSALVAFMSLSGRLSRWTFSWPFHPVVGGCALSDTVAFGASFLACGGCRIALLLRLPFGCVCRR